MEIYIIPGTFYTWYIGKWVNEWSDGAVTVTSIEALYCARYD